MSICTILMKMIKYEIDKIISKSIIFFTIFIIVLDGCNIMLNYNQYSDAYYDHGFSEIYNLVKGEITADKITFVTNNKNHYDGLVREGKYSTEVIDENTYTGYVFSDMIIFDQIYEEMYNCVNYQSLIDSKIKILSENIKKNKNNNSKINDYIVEKLENRKINFFYHMDGIKSYLTYDISFVFSIILSLFICAKLFLVDQPEHIRGIITSIPNGININLKNKIFSLIFIVSILNISFSLFDYIIFNQVTIIDGFLNPIYSIDYFSNSFLNCSVIVFIIIIVISKIIINSFVVCCSFFALSWVKKHIVIIFSLWIGIVFILSNSVKMFRFILQPRELFNNFNLLNINGYVLNKGILILTIMTFMICVYLLFLIYRGDKCEIHSKTT